ncbi:serine hydrolase [Psychrosphaera ytuae]|uniref:Serine hydrolase n=1 Tax=Psychrosphaera ytuae TaxID=2820710 RepID=A0A975DBG8_9GAMM|nr:serine hydrolase [Psychrosphaera ytuae]QTH64056.1 serine hydrolase [Psychrosphaera ytuae]
MLRFILLLTCLYVSFNKVAHAQSSVPNQQDIINTAQDIASQYHQLGWFSGSILITKDNNEVFSAAYGYQNMNQAIPNSIQTRFNLGSIMKDFTKVLILQQVELGKLSLEDKLSQFDLGFQQDDAQHITIQHLLDHRSGLRDIFVAEYRQNPMVFDTLEKKLALLIDHPLLFVPGTERNYSNYGYVVLGIILEKVSGKPFGRLLQENIFDRAKMSSTTLTPIHDHQHQSTRYTYLYDSSLQYVGVNEHPGPDGGLESNVTDLHKFYRALFYSNTLLTNTLALNRQSFAMDGPHWGSYGGGRGISSAVEVDLTMGYQVVVLANSDNLIAERISGRILSFIKTGKYAPVRQLEKNFAYDFYQNQGRVKFKNQFQKAYKDNGYDRFIGRTLNELGMELLKTQSWDSAFDVFEYLVSLFPKAPQVYDSLAFAYLSKGDTEKAKRTFTKSLALKADFNSDYVKNNYGHRPLDKPGTENTFDVSGQ